MSELLRNPYPWQETVWRQSQALITARDRLAILLTGQPGVGKTYFAKALAAWYLCTDKSHTACGRCKSCRLLLADTHPDYFLPALEGKQAHISVGSVRQTNYFLQQTSVMAANGKVALFEHADTMNNAAQNALLKTLEEPPKHTIIILITTNLNRLKATIISRCHRLAMPLAERACGYDWLQSMMPDYQNTTLDTAWHYYPGQPLRVLQACQDDEITQRQRFLTDFIKLRQGHDVSQFAQSWHTLARSQLANWLLAFFRDLMIAKLSLKTDTINQSLVNQINQIIKALAIDTIEQCARHVVLKIVQNQDIALNVQLILESLGYQWRSDNNHYTTTSI